MNKRFRATVLVSLGIMIGLVAPPALSAVVTRAQTGNCQTFQQTGHKVCGRFLQYWQQNGGLAQQGYPLSEEFVETSDLNGRPYTVQYFERAVFELHPENQAPNDVLLSQLGTFVGKDNYEQGFPATSGDVPYYEKRDGTGAQALKSYYNAVNRKDYERAYSYFEGAPNPAANLAPPLEQFVAGYAGTASVALAVGPEETGAAAGSIYSNVPTVLIARQTDGSTQLFQGCYTMRRTNFGISDDPNAVLWRIYAATLKQAPANASVDQLLQGMCASVPGGF